MATRPPVSQHHSYIGGQALINISLTMIPPPQLRETKSGRGVEYFWENTHIDGLVQDCSNSIANALKLLQSCTKPLIYNVISIIFSKWDGIGSWHPFSWKSRICFSYAINANVVDVLATQGARASAAMALMTNFPGILQPQHHKSWWATQSSWRNVFVWLIKISLLWEWLGIIYTYKW